MKPKNEGTLVRHSIIFLAIGIATFAGCADRALSDGNPDVSAPDSGTGTDATEVVGGKSTCAKVCATERDLPGLTVCIWGDRCTFKQGEGGTFHYSIELEKDATFHLKLCQGQPCGGLGMTLGIADAAGMLVFNPECGRGGQCALAMPPPACAVSAGRAESTFEWNGKQIDPCRAQLAHDFPPGSYRATATFDLATEGSVTAALPITVTGP